MPLDNTNLFLSLAILGQNSEVEQSKKFAASVGAALIPGPLGLALPLIVANSESNDNTPPDDVTTLAEVPPVVGRGEETAKKSISDQKLNPLVQHVYIQSGGDGKKGLVVQQDPKAGEFVPLNTDVTLIVSLGVTPGPSQDDSVIDREILQDVKELQEA